MAIQFGTNEAGFVAEVEGFLCFIEPHIEKDVLLFRWMVQEGGGWTWRGNENVVTRAHGLSYSPNDAEKQIAEWLDEVVGGELRV